MSRSVRSVNALIDHMSWYRLIPLIVISAIMGAGAGANIIYHFKLPTILAVVIAIVIAYAQMYFFLEMYKKNKEKEARKNGNGF